MIEDFLHLPPVSLTPVANLDLRISPQIFEKIRNDPTGIPRGLGETDSWKKPEVENLVTLSLLGSGFPHLPTFPWNFWRRSRQITCIINLEYFIIDFPLLIHLLMKLSRRGESDKCFYTKLSTDVKYSTVHAPVMYWSRIQERTILLRFLGITLRRFSDLRFPYIMFT